MDHSHHIIAWLIWRCMQRGHVPALYQDALS